MGIPKQHPHIPVTSNRSHLWNRQPHFKEPTYGLVSQVMEMKVFDPSCNDGMLVN